MHIRCVVAMTWLIGETMSLLSDRTARLLDEPIALVPRLVVLLLCSGTLLSSAAWLPVARSLPKVGFFTEFPILYTPTITLLLLGLAVVGCLLLFSLPDSRLAPSLILFALAFLLIEDALRLQPWVWFAAVLLVVLPRRPRPRPFADASDKRANAHLLRIAAWPEDHDRSRLFGTLRIILAGLYLWSGIWKLNPAFLTEVVPFFADAIELRSVVDALPEIGLVIPVIEIAAGLALLIGWRLRSATLLLGLLHLAVIFALLLLDWNHVVIPWNFVLVALLFIVRERAATEVDLRADLTAAFRSVRGILAFLLAWGLPVIGLFGVAGEGVTWRLYSGLETEAVFVISPEDRDRFADINATHFFQREREGRDMLVLRSWSYDETGLPLPSTQSYLEGLGRRLCERTDRGEEGLRLSIRTPFMAEERSVAIGCDRPVSSLPL